MPEQAYTEQKQLINQGIRSSISVPVMFKGRVQAFIGIDTLKSTKTWSDENIEFLSTAAQILSRGFAELNYDRQIDFMAYYDPLTKLPNPSLLAKELNKGMARARHQEIPISISFIDLDGFKAINDALGHGQGDQLLKQVAKDIETKEQMDFLNKTTSNRLQGYYFHKPMPADEIGKLLI